MGKQKSTKKIIITELIIVLILFVILNVLLVIKVLIPSREEIIFVPVGDGSVAIPTTDDEEIDVTDTVYDPDKSTSITELIENKDELALRLDEARTAVNNGDTAAAHVILEAIDPATLSDAQAEFYYHVSYLYSAAIGDDDAAADAKVQAAEHSTSR